MRIGAPHAALAGIGSNCPAGRCAVLPGHSGAPPRPGRLHRHPGATTHPQAPRSAGSGKDAVTRPARRAGSSAVRETTVAGAAKGSRRLRIRRAASHAPAAAGGMLAASLKETFTEWKKNWLLLTQTLH